MHTRSSLPVRSIFWGAVSAVGCLLVGGYFFLAAGLARFTLFATEPSPFQMDRFHALTRASHLALVSAPIAGLAAFAVGSWLGDVAERHGRTRPLAVGLLGGWILAFVAALPLTQLLPNDAKPLGFGIAWGFGGAVVAPAVIALASMITWRRSVPVSPRRAEAVDQVPVAWWSGQ